MSNTIWPEATPEELEERRRRYPEAFAAFDNAAAWHAQALSLIPDHEPELETYLDWTPQTIVMLHVLLKSFPPSDPSDGDEKTLRQRMASNFLIEALETLNGTMPVEEVRAVNEAVKAKRAEFVPAPVHPEVKP